MRRRPLATVVVAATLGLGLLQPSMIASAAQPPDDTPTLLASKGEHEDGSEEQNFDKLRDAYYWSRLLAGDDPLSVEQAASLRESGQPRRRQDREREASRARPAAAPGRPRARTRSCRSGGPRNTFQAVSGPDRRAGRPQGRDDHPGCRPGRRLDLRHDLAGPGPRARRTPTPSRSARSRSPRATTRSSTWAPARARSPATPTTATASTESTDGGVTWTHVSALFTGQADLGTSPSTRPTRTTSTPRPCAAAAATTARRRRPSPQYGVWESTDGGTNWTLRKGTTDELARRDRPRHGPAEPEGRSGRRSGATGSTGRTDGGVTWASALGNLPAGNFLEGGTRFSLGISHPAGAAHATSTPASTTSTPSDVYHRRRSGRRPTTARPGPTPTGGPATGPDSIVDYCATQCFYDNVVKPDPNNPERRLRRSASTATTTARSPAASTAPPTAAQTWKSLGYDLHPDFHAIAFQPEQHPAHRDRQRRRRLAVAHRRRPQRRGRPAVRASTGRTSTARSTRTPRRWSTRPGLAITQFTRIATVPKVPGQYWGGTQDNGTLRKSRREQPLVRPGRAVTAARCIVDQTTPNTVNPTVPAYVFGTYFGISPYRFDPPTTQHVLRQRADRRRHQPDRPRRVLRPVGRRTGATPTRCSSAPTGSTAPTTPRRPRPATSPGTPISGDLTTGCTGAAPNGARGCLI